MVLYGITLVPLAEDLRDVDPTFLSLFNADDASFYGSVRQSVAQTHLHMEQRPDWGYFPNPSKLIFIADKPEDEESERREFGREGLNLNYVGRS